MDVTQRAQPPPRRYLSDWWSLMATIANDKDALLKALMVLLTAIIGWALLDGIVTDRRQNDRLATLEANQAVLGEINRHLQTIEREVRND